MTTYPSNPILAVTHPDPYPYYADLVAHKPMYYDEALGLWVASSAEAVSAVLTGEHCRVRPVDEPVPATLLDSPAAEIFRQLVRMNDGARHCPLKQAVSTTLQGLDAQLVLERSRAWARYLLDASLREKEAPGLSNFAFYLSTYVLADLLGFPQDQLRQIALWTGDFVRCLASGSTPAQLAAGKSAAGYLWKLFYELLSAQQTGSATSLLLSLADQAQKFDCAHSDGIIANSIGFLSQAYEATAGLIGNTMVALATHRSLREQVQAGTQVLGSVIAEVERYDPPVQNTRRFLSQDGQVAGQALKKNECILVVLAAANRDPRVNAHPERFDPGRQKRYSFTFGADRHACPGQGLALLIAQAGVEQVLSSDYDLEQLARTVSYRPSANVRIALLDIQEEA